MSFGQLRLELQRHITSVSAHSVFLNSKFNADGALIDPDSAAGAPVNILLSTVLPSLEDIERPVDIVPFQAWVFLQSR